MDIQVKSMDSHRNGICGQPFHVVLFDWKDDDTGQMRHMLGIELGEEAQTDLGLAPTFVLDVDMAAAGNVKIFENSWRGDTFTDALRKAIDAERTVE